MDSRINEVNVSVNTVVCWALWVVGTFLVAADALRWAKYTDPGMFGLGLICFGGIRYIGGLAHKLECRERYAFDLGRRSNAPETVKTSTFSVN